MNNFKDDEYKDKNNYTKKNTNLKKMKPLYNDEENNQESNRISTHGTKYYKYDRFSNSQRQ